MVGDRKSLSIAKNHPKPSKEFSEPFGPSMHKMKGFCRRKGTSRSNIEVLQRACMRCNEYMEPCPGGAAPAYQKQGYYVTQDGQSVYQCMSTDACPGGPLQSCPTGSSGPGCAECDDGSSHGKIDRDKKQKFIEFWGLTFSYLLVLFWKENQKSSWQNLRNSHQLHLDLLQS